MINKKSALSRKVLTTTGSILLTGTASLHAHPEELEETTILANKVVTATDEVGSSVSVLDPEKLKKQGILYLDDALKHVPGVISESIQGQRGSGSSLLLRGTRTNQTHLRVDGMRISGPNIATNNFLGGTNLNGLSRIEILKGPQGAVYGGDAIGGVIGIYTDEGTDEHQGSLSLKAGSFNTFKSSLTQQGSFDRLYYSLGVSYEETDNDLPNNSFDQESYHLRLDYDVNPDLDIGLTLRSFNSGFDRPSYYDPAYSFAAHDETDSTLGTIFADYHVNQTWQSKLTLGAYEEEFLADGVYSTDASKGNKYAAYWDNTLNWNGRHTTATGLVYEKTDYSYSNESFFGTFGDDRNNNQYGLYLNHTWSVDDNLTLNGGVRWEDYDTYGDETTWRTSAAYHIRKTNTKLRASAGKGFRPPSVNDLYGFGGFVDVDLDAEESFGWDAGIDQEFLDGQYTLSVTYFENRIKNYIEPFTSTNESGTRKTQGFELSAKGSWLEELLTASLSYTYLDKAIDYQPRHSAGLRINGEVSDSLNLGINATYLSDRRFNQEIYADEVDSYILTNVYANYKVAPNLTLNTGVENVFDVDYDYFSSFGSVFPGRSRGVFAGLTYTW